MNTNNNTAAASSATNHPSAAASSSGTATNQTATAVASTSSANGAAAAASLSKDAASASTAAPEKTAPVMTDDIVLDYLRRKGLGTAALELAAKLKELKPLQEQDSAKNISTSGSSEAKDKKMSEREILEEEDAVFRNQRTLLSKSTGGSYGSDRDSAWPVVQWGIPDAGRAPIHQQRDKGRGQQHQASSNKDIAPKNTIPDANPMGVDEARAYLDAFTSIQLWVLSLPDGGETNGIQQVDNPVKRAQALLQSSSNNGEPPTLAAVMEELAKPPTRSKDEDALTFNLPPSAKPELLAVTFALLVHTYCELLEVGMETTAHCLRDAFRPIYEPLFTAEFRDLLHCTTTEGTMRLNSHNSQHMEALNSLKSILVQIASYQLRREELHAQTTVGNINMDAQQLHAQQQKIKDYDRNINILKQKHTELSQRASAAFEKMEDLPFLRRARAVRWQLTLSTTTYGLLSSFLNQSDDSLLAMSTLLQTKCELHIERRDPLPFTPACVLNETRKGESALEINEVDIRWAAPAAMDHQGASMLKLGEKLPFPKFQLDEEYNTTKEASRDRRRVEFNRALLMNGFRRLEALEKKRSYETLPAAVQKRIKSGDASVLQRPLANPLEPSILLTTLTSNISGPVLRPKAVVASSSRSGSTDTASIWEEAGVGICCAQLCQPDGRRIAAGCDDASVRIYDAMDDSRNEPSHVLLGHKNGFSVFDVDWNRDGRCLLSAGGDGSVRLWDTMAVGPFGEVTSLNMKPSSDTVTKKTSEQYSEGRVDTNKDPNMSVPGLRGETAPYSSGAALAVYRGHAPSSPVWSVSFSPSGYYFASAAADATARLWTTDRMIPVRLLTGHTASNINCVKWHPNCNYVLTGADDKTCRLWDIQTGRTVRLLSGCRAGVNAVNVSPDGRFAVGADYSGSVHIWDLGNGKKITELRPPQRDRSLSVGNPLVHSLSFSACGTTLATGGDDCVIRLWDVQSDTLRRSPISVKPVSSFPTQRSLLLDLQYTKRNLLLAVGKLVTPVPLLAT